MVGTICCDNLTGTTLARIMESLARFATDWPHTSVRWKSDNWHAFIQQKEIDLEYHKIPSCFHIQMNGCCGKQVFSTIEEAKIAAFEVIESGKAGEFLRKKGLIRHRENSRRTRRKPPISLSGGGRSS